MTNFNTSASANTVDILPSQKLNIMNEINNIIVTKTRTVTTREFTGMVKNPKPGCKGMVKRHKLVTRETSVEVIDTQATVVARKAAIKALLEGKKVVVDNTTIQAQIAAKRSIAQRAIEREEARLFQIEQAGFVGQLARIEEQIATLRAAKGNTSFGKARIRDAAKVNVKAPRIRTGRKPARLTVPAQQSFCFIGKLAPVAIPVRDVKVSREEARALLAVSTQRPFLGRASSTMEAIAMLDRVDSLVFTALQAIATGEAFILAAQARMNDTVNTLPAAAATMTMSLDNNLVTIHNFVMNYMTDNGVTNYSQAVMESYEDICIEQGINLTDELKEAILDMADGGIATGGDVTHDKNITVEVDPSTAQTPVNNTGDSPAMTNVNASTFANAAAFAYGDIPVSYDEVAPLVNFALADELVNFDGEGTSFAEVLASLMYQTEKLQKPLPSETEEDVREINATIERKNARAIECRETFLAKFDGKLGHVAKLTLGYNSKADYAKASMSLQAHYEAMFTMCEYAAYEGVEHSYSGLELDSNAAMIDICGESAGATWLAMLAKATFNLTSDERTELLALLFHDTVRVSNGVIIRDKISINLTDGIIVTGNGTARRVNKAACFGHSNYNGFIVIDGLHALFLFALQALGGTSKQLETSINLAVKLFQPEHNYGHRPDHDDMAHFVRTNFVYTNAVKATNTDFPSIEVIGGKQDPTFLGWVLNRGVVATCDKTNIKFVTINAGAEAVGVGYTRDTFGNLDQMFTSNDANKPTKLFNRAAANNYDCADMADRVASNFGFTLSNGKVARTKGKMMKVAYTNSLLTFGSGVGIINVDSKFSFTIPKKEKAATNVTMFGYDNINNPKAKQAIVEKIEEAIKAAKGTEFNAGDVMISIEHDGESFDLVSNSEKAAKVVVTGGKVRNNVLDENSFEVIIDVALMGNTGFVKTRRFATKFTTVPYEAEFVGLNNEWDIILNNECTKGHGALLEMFANATGERHLNNGTCMLSTPDGESFDIRSESNPFYDWRNDNIICGAKLRMTIAKSVWENQSRFVGDTVVVITETTDCDGYPCVIVFDVEISSPLESVSNSSLTLESASAIYLQSERLGNHLFAECNKKADKFVALANRFSAMDVNDMEVIDLEDDGSYNAFIVSLPKTPEGKRLTQRQILAAIAVKYPSGVEFLVGDSSFPLNLGLVASFGSYNGLNGSASRETAEVMNFLLDVIYNYADNRKKLLSSAKRAFAKIVNTAVASKNVLKKPTRAGKLIYGKVRTSFHPMLHSEDGIPTIILNINCPMVEMLGIPTDGSIVNYYVGFARTPMPFLGGSRVRLTADRNICDVAHVLVDPYVWHQLNEGDSDGDGIACLNLSALSFTLDEVRELNSSIMGIAGYEHLYGENVPYADFVSPKDKAGKKSFHSTIKLMSTQIKDPDSDKNVDIIREFVADFAARVANHYKSAVGTSYGICSKLVFQAADWAADKDENITNVLTATLIAWRAMYEGLGLSGYSAKAARVFKFINLATTDLECQNVLYSDTAKSHASIWDKEFKAEFPDAKEVSGAVELSKLDAFEDFNVPVEVFEFILDSRAKTKVAVRLEGFGNPLTKFHYGIPNLVEGATKYGVLRRISQGDDRVAEELGLKEEAILAAAGEHVSVALSRRFGKKAGEMAEHFSNEALFNLTVKVCEFHTQLLLTQGKNRDAENRA